MFGKLWWGTYSYIKKIKTGKISLKIHGFKVIQPIAFTYPFTARLFKHFNNPLIECVFQTSLKRDKKIRIIDVGAAIGDTVLLLKSNTPSLIEKYYCIDGDDEFFGYLKKNMEQFSDVECINAVLSDTNESVNELVRIHGGTASAQGSVLVNAKSLDNIVFKENIQNIDVLKIDVDGYDGKVLNGAGELLKRDTPTVIFEWHPKLYASTGNQFNVPFIKLMDTGYDRFIWFTKYGEFSHFTLGYDEKYVNQFAEICLNSSVDMDLHYDIVALHSASKHSITDFADSNFSRNRKSRF
jgi:FkbM family methyltransferase